MTPSSRKPNQPFETRDQTFEVFGRHVSCGKVDTFRAYGIDVVMGERKGPVFGDGFSDRRWFNCHCNGGVFNLGHRNPEVVAAVQQALETLDMGNHHLVSGFRAQVAARLADTTSGKLEGVTFGVGGGEAVDLAIKVCRAGTGRTGVVSADGGYHGHTGLAMAAGDAKYREMFGPNPAGFVQVPFNDLAALDRAVGDDTAAVILEPIPATLGMPIPSPGYLEGVSRICSERGAKLILDEVQTGLGRTGRMWAYMHHDITPDVLVTAKGLSGGIYPVSATLMTAELHRLFGEHPFVHVSTCGGAEVGCAAALKVLDIVEGPGFCERVHALSERFAAGFKGLSFELRRRGLMMGFKFPVVGAGLAAAKVMYDAGVFCVYANNDTSVLQFLPVLTLTDAEAEEIVQRVRGAFS